MSVILTLMVPYNLIDADAPLMEMFSQHRFYSAKYVVALGSIAGLTVSLLGSLFPMPRVIYAMAGDGLLFRLNNKHFFCGGVLTTDVEPEVHVSTKSLFS